jgi:ATP-binding cassette subfamily B protein
MLEKKDTKKETRLRLSLGGLKSLRSLWPWIKPHQQQVLYAFGAIVLVAIALLSLGRGLAYLVDSGLSKGNEALLDRAVLICLVAAAMLALGSYLRAVLINKVAERVIADIRKATFRHTLGLSTSWFEMSRTGDVLSTISVDTTMIQTVMASTLSMSARNILVLIGGVTMVVLTSPKLTLIILAVIPLVVLPVVILGRRLRVQSRIAQDRLADISVEAEEALSAIHTIHAFAQEDAVVAMFNKATEASHDASIKRLVLRGTMSGVVILLVFSAITCILWVGGKDLLAGEMSAGDLSAFVFYATLVASSVGALSDVSGEFQRAAGAAERIAKLLDEEQTITNPAYPVAIPQGAIGFEFDNVSFAYASRSDLPALRGVSLNVKPSERVALVGPSGAGKSTFLNLILRLNDPTEGRVLVGGIDARKVLIENLRGVMGFVPQETVLFSGTIASNIAFGDPKATPDHIRDAAKRAFAHDFIKNFPQGYETPVGERGVRLSGGQRQRIAIARAILRNPQILLLDEATSSLDAQSEQAVAEALEDLMKDRTTLVIAHRLSTVINAGRIIVLDQGQVVATGSHDDLLASSQLYHDLASLQLLASV